MNYCCFKCWRSMILSHFVLWKRRFLPALAIEGHPDDDAAHRKVYHGWEGLRSRLPRD